MQQQYGGSFFNTTKLYEWIDRFKSDRISLCNEQRKGMPSTSNNNGNIEAIKQIIHSIPQMNTD